MNDTERRELYAAAMAKRDGHPWPTEFEDDERDYRRRADAAMAVADAELESASGQLEARRIELLRVNERHAADRAAVLTDTERQFLTFALGLAADRVASRGDEFTDDDTAAPEKLLRMTVTPDEQEHHHA